MTIEQEDIEKLHSKLDSIEKRLFRDNGSVSIQTRLDRHEQVQRLLLWIVGIIGGTLLWRSALRAGAVTAVWYGWSRWKKKRDARSVSLH